MKLFKAALVGFGLVAWAQIAVAAFAIFQTYGDEIPVVTCNIVTGVATGTGGGTCVASPATCDGNPLHNDVPAFTEFNTWAQAWQVSNSGLIQLSIPNGATCMFMSGGNSGCPSSCFANGIRKLRVVGLGASSTPGSGATISDGTTGNGFFLGSLPQATPSGGQCSRGIAETDGCSARFQTVSAGATCILLTSSSLSSGYISRFSVGVYAMTTGIDLQGAASFPTNTWFYEYRKITGINAGTGEICFDAPLTYGYKSTWPLIFAGNASQPDGGGPATIYTMGPAWDGEVEYRGITIDQQAFQTYSALRSVIYRNVKFLGSPCGVPSQNITWTVVDSDMSGCAMEADKNVISMTLLRTTIRRMLFQSSSIETFYLTNSTVTEFINGTPKRMIGSQSNIGTTPGDVDEGLFMGAWAYGITNEVSCTSCVITQILTSGDNQGSGLPIVTPVFPALQMASGVLRIPTSQAISALTAGASGKVRITVSTTAAWSTGQRALVDISSISGDCAEADGNWFVTVIDGTHIDLDGTTFSSGSITDCSLNAEGSVPPAWAVPGANIVWNGRFPQSTPTMQVTDLTQDANSIYVHTTEAGSFPAVPGGGVSLTELEVGTHPAPKFTCSGCTGSFDALMWAQAAPSIPFGSWWTRTFVVGNTTPIQAQIWGTIEDITVTVNTAYAGASSPNFNIDNVSVQDGASFNNWQPTFDPKTLGVRLITPSAITCDAVPGDCSGDSATAPPAVAFIPSNQITPQFSTVPGDFGSTSVTITIQMDQGVVNP